MKIYFRLPSVFSKASVIRKARKRNKATAPPTPTLSAHIRKVNTPVSNDPLSPESILARAAYADLTLELARWILRRWNSLPPFQQSAIRYALDFGGDVGDGQVAFTVQLSSLLEALAVLRRQPVPEE